MKKAVIVAVLFVVILLFGGSNAKAATRTVDTVADNAALTTCNNAVADDCSLRGAITNAGTGDTINFSSTVFATPQTISLGSSIGFLHGDTLVVDGPGPNLLTIAGTVGNTIGLFNVPSGVVTIRNLTMANVSGASAYAVSVSGSNTRTTISGCVIYNIVRTNGSSNSGALATFSGSLAVNNTELYDNAIAMSASSAGTLSIFGVTIRNSTKYGIFAAGDVSVSDSVIKDTVGTNVSGIVVVASNRTVNITNSLFTGNNVTNVGGSGAAIDHQSGLLTITNSTFSGNSATTGSAINSSTTTNAFTLQIFNVTVTGNNTPGGGAIHVLPTANTSIRNSIIAGNTGNSTPDVYGSVFATNNLLGIVNFPWSGFVDQFGNPINGNLVGTVATPLNPLLAALSNNGGTTQTYALLQNSPAIDRGTGCVLTNNGCGGFTPALLTDQRGTGFSRLIGTAVDIGAFEFGALLFTPVTLPTGLSNVAYSQQISVAGGTAPYAFTLESGVLPTGFTIASGGLLSGTTAQNGVFNFVVRGTDANGVFAVKSYVLVVGFTVTNDNSSGAGSLRQLINDTPAGGTIYFDPAFFNVPRGIALGGTALTINKNLTINGTGSTFLTIDGGSVTRVLSIESPAVLTLNGIRLAFGNGSGSVGGCILNNGTLIANDLTLIFCTTPSLGGGIFNAGPMTLTNSLITSNNAAGAGGIYNNGGQTANINYTTVSNNVSTGGGGGIGNVGTVSAYGSTIVGNSAAFGGGANAGTLMILNNSTVSGNTATNNKAGGVYIGSGERLETTNATITNNVSNGNLFGGIYSDGGLFQARNTIVAGNRNGDGSATDVAASILSYGYNIIGTTAGNSFDPGSPVLLGNRVNIPANLAPLASYGGPTQTHALLPASQAINNGDPGNSVFTFDQRGVSRPIGSQDIGAFERNVAIDQTTIANGNQNIAYSRNLTASRLAGQFHDAFLAPFTFAIVTVAGQSLPPGLTLASDGTISGTPTTIGLYTFTVKATDTDGMAGVQQYSMYVFAPTSANVVISGRLLTAYRQGLRGAVVVLTGSDGLSRTARSTSLGYFRFDAIASGETYTISVQSKRFTFAPRLITVNDAVEDLELVAEP